LSVSVHTWEPNSNSGKPLFALAEKGVPFEHVYVDITRFEQHAPEYLALNPAGTVPTMIHDGRIFTESTPMCEYIDRTFDGPALMPADPAERYRVREWCRRTDMAAAALSVLGWHSFLGPMVRAMPADELDRLIARIPTRERRIAWAAAAKSTFTDQQLADARARVGAWAAVMDRQLARTPFLAGETYTLADLVAFANFWGLPMTVPEYANPEATPHYVGWLRRMYARPASQQLFETSRSLGKAALGVAAQLRETEAA
jgi:GSH-dependent disulfide-bond oxidoreductase